MQFRSCAIGSLIRVLALSWVGWSISVSQAEAAPASLEETQAPAEAMRRWQDRRFGMFIHYGPVSLMGTEISWSRAGERRDRQETITNGIPAAAYDALYLQFNPTKFNAREWVATAKRAGMKYIVFTTKHHDGFVMFDSALTDYKITRSPFQRDLVAELAQACHEAGLALGFYYSPPDWHHPDFFTTNHVRYVEYLHGQVRELLTKYGTVDTLWFDGTGGTNAPETWGNKELFPVIRALQPRVVMNKRCGGWGDFDTPEQTVGRFQNHCPWETCMTICNQWAWKPGDRMKSLKECLGVLVRCAGGDGNLLFNVGPMPTGEIEPRQAQRLHEMGSWLAWNGESVYGTRGGPYLPTAWAVSTRKGRTIYLHILDWPCGQGGIRIPTPGARISSATLLTGGALRLHRTDRAIEIDIPARFRQDIDTIVALQVEGPVADLPLLTLDGRRNVPVIASEASCFHPGDSEWVPGKAFDGDPASRWATPGGTHSAWIEADFGKPEDVTGLSMSEACGKRIEGFTVQASVNGEWKVVAAGTTVGEDFRVDFPTVRTHKMRISVTKASEGPTLWEISFLTPAL
jgi:alpha-L-fucosidase